MRKGFSLVELVVVLVLVGVVGATGSLGLINAIQGFTFARDNAELAEKAEAAMLRLRIEFSHIKHDPDATPISKVEISDSSSDYSITYTAVFNDADETHTVALVGDEVRIDGIPLTDRIESLQFGYLDKLGAPASSPDLADQIEVILVMTGANDIQKNFTTRVAIFAKSYENG